MVRMSVSILPLYPLIFQQSTQLALTYKQFLGRKILEMKVFNIIKSINDCSILNSTLSNYVSLTDRLFLFSVIDEKKR